MLAVLGPCKLGGLRAGRLGSSHIFPCLLSIVAAHGLRISPFLCSPATDMHGMHAAQGTGAQETMRPADKQVDLVSTGAGSLEA